MKTIKDAVKWAEGMNGKAAPGGPGHCQELVRDAYGLPAWATSAKLAFAKIPKNQLHTTPLKLAPAGAMVYFPTLSDFGHVILSVGGGKALSNDYALKGYCNIVNIELPNWHGEQHYGGWSLWTPYGVAK